MKSFVQLCTLFFLLAALTACGGSGKNSTTTIQTPFTNPPSLPVRDLQLTTAATVSTFAGKVWRTSGDVNGITNGDGSLATATFHQPNGIATADGTTFYVSDYKNHRVRVITGGTVSTLRDLSDKVVDFYYPTDVAIADDKLFVADGSHAVRQYTIGSDGRTTLAATYGTPYSAGAVDSTTTLARFNDPTGLATDGTYVYVAESGNHTIRRIEIATQQVTTVAGYPGKVGSTDGIGTAARFSTPSRLATDGKNLYVTDFYNRTIRRIDLATGQVTTIAGQTDIAGEADGAVGISTFNHPTGITTDGTFLYVTDINDTTLPNPAYKNLIRRIEIAGTHAVTTIAGGLSATLEELKDGTGTTARFSTLAGLVAGNDGLYVADSGNHVIRKISVPAP